ncbi:MAG: hypothetical protein ACP5GH_06955 [Nitrososphaeria archaeon]
MDLEDNIVKMLDQPRTAKEIADNLSKEVSVRTPRTAEKVTKNLSKKVSVRTVERHLSKLVKEGRVRRVTRQELRAIWEKKQNRHLAGKRYYIAVSLEDIKAKSLMESIYKALNDLDEAKIEGYLTKFNLQQKTHAIVDEHFEPGYPINVYPLFDLFNSIAEHKIFGSANAEKRRTLLIQTLIVLAGFDFSSNAGLAKSFEESFYKALPEVLQVAKSKSHQNDEAYSPYAYLYLGFLTSFKLSSISDLKLEDLERLIENLPKGFEEFEGQFIRSYIDAYDEAFKSNKSVDVKAIIRDLRDECYDKWYPEKEELCKIIEEKYNAIKDRVS